jgi:electron transport complex protein RnfB
MNNNKNDVYRQLQKYLDTMPVGFPETESGIELKILKQLFTPEQAQIALNLKFQPEKIKNVYRRIKNMGIGIEELEQKLDEMYFNGLINRGITNKGSVEVKYYASAPFVVGFYEYQLNKLTPELYHDAEQYLREFFVHEYNKTGIPQLRVIPVEESVEMEHAIANYDELKTIIENIGRPIALSECICRKGKDMIGESCKKTSLRESCFSFRNAAKSLIEKGDAREVTIEEALKIIEKAQEDGLVLQPGNSIRPAMICTCCGCCCGILTNQKIIPEPANFFATNYYAEVDIDLCIGCGTCEERCNMDAVHVEDAIAIVDKLRCIGCGVCVTTCTSEAIKLYRKEDEIIPPKNTLTTYMTIMDRKAELARAEKE